LSAPIIFDLSGVSFSYAAPRPVLEAVSLNVHEADFLGLIGPNGTGKTTLLHLLSGLLRPAAGMVRLLGKPVAQWSRVQLARQFAVVPQREERAFAFTVAETVLLGRYARGTSGLGFESAADRSAVARALEAVCLEGFEHRPVTELSGGEFQRVLLARALAQDTPMLLLDEPTSSLDLAHQKLFFSLLKRLQQEERKTIIAVSHDLNLASLYCSELLLLYRGGILAKGPPIDVLQKPFLEQAFGLKLEIAPLPSGTRVVMPHP